MAGDGATGGAGGSLKNISSVSVFDQNIQVACQSSDPNSANIFVVEINPVTAQLTAGRWRQGHERCRRRGRRGQLSFPLRASAISIPTPPPRRIRLLSLPATAATARPRAGGAGAISGVASFNAPFAPTAVCHEHEFAGASIASGHGGNGGSLDGGAGGAISGLNIGVEGFAIFRPTQAARNPSLNGGDLKIVSGAGGNGGAHGKGGAAGQHHEFTDRLQPDLRGLRVGPPGRGRRQRGERRRQGRRQSRASI